MNVIESKIGLRYDNINLERLDAGDPDWSDRVDGLRRALGAPNNSLLFPSHYLKVVLPKIGGRIDVVRTSKDKVVAASFVFPRIDGRYLARVHSPEGMVSDVSSLFGYGEDVRLYYPEQDHFFSGEELCRHADYTIGRPSACEAVAARELQRMVWGIEDDDYLYPSDIYSFDFGMPTALVAKTNDGDVIGFLWGVAKHSHTRLPGDLEEKYGPSELRIESQLMSVRSDMRGKGIGFELKKTQATLAKELGVEVINWTYDPLQIFNTRLNIGKLRAIVYEHHRDYYPFRNDLNRVAASRFSVTWLVNSDRAAEALRTKKQIKTRTVDLRSLGENVTIVNNGYKDAYYNADGTPWIAFETPDNWGEIQLRNPRLAEKWRDLTDNLFEHYLGPEGKGYAICEVGRVDNKHLLLARKIGDIAGL